jgi:hypothetical protein
VQNPMWLHVVKITRAEMYPDAHHFKPRMPSCSPNVHDRRVVFPAVVISDPHAVIVSILASRPDIS